MESRWRPVEPIAVPAPGVARCNALAGAKAAALPRSVPPSKRPCRSLTHQQKLMYCAAMASAPPDPRILARRFQALGDEVRIEVVRLLRGGERCVCELTAVLQVAQSRLSFHLKVLKDSGLLLHRKAGRWSYYALDAEAFREIESFLRQVPAPAAPCCQPVPSPAAASGPTPKRSCNAC